MEASEHLYVGNSIQLTVANGDTTPASGVALELNSGPLTYGYIVALGGDFYGTPDITPISNAANPAEAVVAFKQAFATLDNANAAERNQITDVIKEEVAAVNTAIGNGQPPSTAFDSDHLGDSLSCKWNAITYHGNWPIANTYLGQLAAVLAGIWGRYLDLAAGNLDHFGDDAWTAYVAGHTAALEQAKSLHGQPGSSLTTQKGLRIAYAMNAFADHFLTDLFAGGHSRTPRRELNGLDGVSLTARGILSKAMHGEDNQNGVLYVNRADSTDTWVAYGDGRVRNPENQANLQRVTTAVQRSADLVYGAYLNGYYDSTHGPMLELIPIAGGMDGPGTPTQGPQIRTAPLFCIDSYRHVYCRNTLSDPADYTYAHDWSPTATAGQIVARDYLGIGAKSVPLPV